MALEVAGSKPVTRPIIRLFETELIGACAWRLSQSRYKTASRNGLFAGVAELVDALVLGTSGESRGGSSPSARTIGAWRNFDGVTVLRETPRLACAIGG